MISLSAEVSAFGRALACSLSCNWLDHGKDSCGILIHRQCSNRSGAWRSPARTGLCTKPCCFRASGATHFRALHGGHSLCTNLQYSAHKTGETAIIRVAIYARVSTGEQNPELQLRELRDYAGRRGFAMHREYVDLVSGDVRRHRRAPAFDALMTNARRRRVGAWIDRRL
jgi:hypothetical protein